jgi:hypothetical protein
MKQTFIYALVDPRAPEQIRYVGKANDTTARMKAHVYLAKCKATNPRLCWIQALLNAGIIPEVQVLEAVITEKWQSREQFWIAYFRASGHRLTNTTDGGDGGASCRGLKRAPFSPEHRAKISAWHKGKKHSLETRQKMSATRKGKKRSAAHNATLYSILLGKKRTLAARARMSASAKAAHARRRAEAAA